MCRLFIIVIWGRMKSYCGLLFSHVLRLRVEFDSFIFEE